MTYMIYNVDHKFSMGMCVTLWFRVKKHVDFCLKSVTVNSLLLLYGAGYRIMWFTPYVGRGNSGNYKI